MPKVMITGVNGFVGHHLARELKSQGHEVHGVGLQPGAAADLAQLLDAYHGADLTNRHQAETLPLTEMDAIISLAGLADVGASFKQAERYMQVNTSVVTNISEALIAAGSKTRHLAVSSGAVYDAQAKPPFDESSPTSSASSPYVASKLAMEEASRAHHEQGLDIIIARPFNHIGPGQETNFILPDLVSQVRRYLSDGSPLRVGNIDTRRDYTDVRDVARAYGALALSGSKEHFIYNVCSGRSVAGRQILELVLKNLSPDTQPEVVADPSKMRPNDAPDLYGDYRRLHEQTGWAPMIPLAQTVHDYLYDGRPHAPASPSEQPGLVGSVS